MNRLHDDGLTADVECAGQRLVLRADHSVYWPAQRTLLVADTHFGKAGVFRRQGLGVPAGTTDADLARLTNAVAETACECLVVLGDFLHAPPGGDEPWLAQFAAWRGRHRSLSIVVTRGNHDRASALPAGFDLDWRTGALVQPPFVLTHEPGADTRGHVLAGHLHPVVRMRDRAESVRAPAFWLTERYMVLPAFCSFAGGQPITPVPGERVFVLGDGAITEARLAAR